MNVTLNWVGFRLSQIKNTICKIRKEYIKNIFFLEEQINEYIGNKLISIIEFSYFRGKNKEIHRRWSKVLLK